MKIRIEEVPAQGLHKEQRYDPQDLDLEILESRYSLPVKFSTPIDAIADIVLIGKEMVIQVLVKYKLKLVCSRCLEEFELLFEKKYFFNYNTQNLEVVDITGNIREEIILAYPMKPLCRENCQGICSKCGVNLNIEKCKCNK